MKGCSGMEISEVAKLTGLAVSTIRFYEKSGLCPAIQRGADGKRRFSRANVDWLELLASLRATGMPMCDMRTFADLYASGDATIPERKAALLSHRKSLEVRQAELEHCRKILDRKLQIYNEITKDRT